MRRAGVSDPQHPGVRRAAGPAGTSVAARHEAVSAPPACWCCPRTRAPTIPGPPRDEPIIGDAQLRPPAPSSWPSSWATGAGTACVAVAVTLRIGSELNPMTFDVERDLRRGTRHDAATTDTAPSTATVQRAGVAAAGQGGGRIGRPGSCCPAAWSEARLGLAAVPDLHRQPGPARRAARSRRRRPCAEVRGEPGR